MKTLQQLCDRALQPSKRPQIRFDGRWYSREDLSEVARAYWACTDHLKSAKVAYVANNRPASLALMLAMLARGHSINMVYSFQSSEAMCAKILSMQPHVIVLERSRLTPELECAAEQLGCVLVSFDELDVDVIQFARKTAQGPEPELVLLTSGTSGSPKPFRFSYETVLDNYTGNATEVVDIESEPQGVLPHLLYFPLSNITGLFLALPPLLLGQSIVLLDRFNLEAWLDYVDEYKPVFIGLPPSAYKMILDANVAPSRLASIKYMGSGAAPLDLRIKQEFEIRYEVAILFAYGATEFGGPVTRFTPDMLRQATALQRTSQGMPLPGMQVRIVDPETGRGLPAGERGRVEVVSARIGPEWISTNDMGSVDETGFVYLYGRLDGAIYRGGFKLLPETIEAGLLQLPAVADCAVVAVPDERLGHVPGVAVVLKPNLETDVSESDLAHQLRTYLLATEIPVHWRFVSELPRNASFKVSRQELAALFN